MIVIPKPKRGDILDASLTSHPSRLEMVEGKHTVTDNTLTSYGYVISGGAEVRAKGCSFRAAAGMYFCMPGEFELDASGLVAVIYRFGYHGLLTVGRAEDYGRLAYLNGCSATILVSPPRAGDPVLNHLHIPKDIDQTPHTHPSVRIGIIVRGGGTAYGRDESTASDWNETLTEGCIFLLPAEELHAFRTLSSEHGMDLITYHPDSDWGPRDEDHPMLTATHLDNRR